MIKLKKLTFSTDPNWFIIKWMTPLGLFQKFEQTRTKSAKIGQNRTNSDKIGQIRTNTGIGWRICPNLSKFARIFPNLLEFIRTIPTMFEWEFHAKAPASSHDSSPNLTVNLFCIKNQNGQSNPRSEYQLINRSKQLICIQCSEKLQSFIASTYRVQKNACVLNKTAIHCHKVYAYQGFTILSFNYR